MAETPPGGSRWPEPTLFFEDFAPGQVIDLGIYEMTEAEIIDFGRRFDPQYFHIDPEAAKDSPFGGLIASGWHTCSAWARMWIDSVLSRVDSRGSPGMEQVRWFEPVRPGDRLACSVEILETRPSARHADRGTVFIACTMNNQHGAVVMSTKGRGLFGRRHPVVVDPAAGAPDSDKSTCAVPTPDGVNLNLRVVGGSGPDLLICHATGLHGSAYSPLALNLKERFRVWALDFRGHGSSEPSPTGDYRWRHMGVDVAACAAAIDSERLYGFGHSMGGAALLLAEEQSPGLFAGLFLYEPIVLPEGHFARVGSNVLARGARNRREVFDSRDAALTRYAARSPLSVLRADALAAYVQDGFVDLPDGRVRLACRAETEALTFESSGELPIERVGSIDVDAAVAAGSVPSVPNPAEFAPITASKLPRGRFLEYESLGHFGPLEAPGVVAADVIRELLER